jgi:hypothetical protein
MKPRRFGVGAGATGADGVGGADPSGAMLTEAIGANLDGTSGSPL